MGSIQTSTSGSLKYAHVACLLRDWRITPIMLRARAWSRAALVGRALVGCASVCERLGRQRNDKNFLKAHDFTQLANATASTKYLHADISVPDPLGPCCTEGTHPCVPPTGAAVSDEALL